MSPQEVWESYNVALEQSPLLVKSLTAGVILGAADLTGQAVESFRDGGRTSTAANTEQPMSDGVDLARVVRFAIFGLALQAVRVRRRSTLSCCVC